MQTNNDNDGINGPKTPQDDYTNQPDQSPRREGGDDSLAERSSPNDARADEKVIVNEQREDKIVNTPSQTAVHRERTAGDEEIINR